METRSLLYVLDHLGKLTKIPLTIRVEKKTAVYLPAKEVVISPQFFRSAFCKRCGNCCHKGVSLAFSSSDIYNIERAQSLKLFAGLQKYEIEVNGEKRYWWLHNQTDSKTCDFLEQNMCGIHAVKATNCLLPHIFVDYSKKNQITKLTKRPFGSRWIPNCELEFGQFDAKELEEWDLRVLRQLCRNAEDWGISTFLPEITNYLETWLRVYKTSEVKNIWLPKSSIYVFGGKSVEDDEKRFW